MSYSGSKCGSLGDSVESYVAEREDTEHVLTSLVKSAKRAGESKLVGRLVILGGDEPRDG
jgi:hypothetical protein